MALFLLTISYVVLLLGLLADDVSVHLLLPYILYIFFHIRYLTRQNKVLWARRHIICLVLLGLFSQIPKDYFSFLYPLANTVNVLKKDYNKELLKGHRLRIKVKEGWLNNLHYSVEGVEGERSELSPADLETFSEEYFTSDSPANKYPTYPMNIIERWIPFFSLILFLVLFPFIFLALRSIKSREPRENTKKIKEATSLNWSCHILSYIFIFSAAVNDGITGPYLAIPFLGFLVLDILLGNSIKKKVVSLVFIILMFGIHQADRSTWRFFYVRVGEEHTVDKEQLYELNPFFPFKISRPFKEATEPFSLKGERFKITNQYVTGINFTSPTYVYRIELLNKKLAEELLARAKKKEIKWKSIGEGHKSLSQDSLYIDYSFFEDDKSWSMTQPLVPIGIVLALPFYIFGLVLLSVLGYIYFMRPSKEV